MKRIDNIVVGIDLGGTFVRAGVVDQNGRVLSWAETPIEAARGPEEGLRRIIEQTEIALEKAGGRKLVGIGMGSTGPVDRARGAIQNPYTLPTWEDVDVLTPLRERFQVPAVLENDADAAALGEYWQGAGQGVDHLVVVTVGTGIGTAFVYRGELYRGLRGVHPEIGHQVLDPKGPLCYCGARGCWESLAAGPAIARLARKELTRERKVYGSGESQILQLAGGNLAEVSGRHVTDAARMGDPTALRVVGQAATYLALGLVNVILFFVPETILLGGGVMKSFDLFKPTLDAVIARHGLMVPAHEVRVRPVGLGREAGVIGAAYAVLKELEKGT